MPVKIAFINKSTGAQTYTWTFEGGSPETYTQKDPAYADSFHSRSRTVAKSHIVRLRSEDA